MATTINEERQKLLFSLADDARELLRNKPKIDIDGDSMIINAGSSNDLNVVTERIKAKIEKINSMPFKIESD